MTKWDHGGGCEGVSCCFKCVRVFIRLAAVALPTADTPKMFQSEVDQRNHHKKKYTKNAIMIRTFLLIQKEECTFYHFFLHNVVSFNLLLVLQLVL